jgi:TolB-like protein
MAPPPTAEPGGSQTAPSADQGIPILVVLPFQDLTAEQMEQTTVDLDKLGKGIAEEFGTDLATFPDFEVVSSSSAFAYVGKPIPEIVALTGATFVVEGSLRKTGDKVLVTLQVIRGSTDRHLKIVQIEEKLADPVTMQKSIAAKLRDDLGGMTGVFRHEYEKMAWDKAEADLTEYDFYIRGHSYHLWGDQWTAKQIWQDGLARFPDSMLLHCKLVFSFLYTSPKEAAALVNKAAMLKRRSALDEWYYHWATADAFNATGDHKRAVAEARATIDMAPYDTVSHADLSWVMSVGGDKDTAIEWATFAVTHDAQPFKWYFDNLEHAYRNTKRWPEAIALAEAQIVKDPIHAKWWYDFLGAAHLGTGQTDKATEAFKKAQSLPSPPQPWTPPR